MSSPLQLYLVNLSTDCSSSIKLVIVTLKPKCQQPSTLTVFTLFATRNPVQRPFIAIIDLTVFLFCSFNVITPFQSKFIQTHVFGFLSPSVSSLLRGNATCSQHTDLKFDIKKSDCVLTNTIRN